MKLFRDFLEAVDTPGGHICICIVLGMTGVIVAARGHEMAAAGLLGFLTAAAALMRGKAQ